MLICTVFTDKNNQFSKLIITPEVHNGDKDEVIEIAITNEQADEIRALEDISKERE